MQFRCFCINVLKCKHFICMCHSKAKHSYTNLGSVLPKQLFIGFIIFLPTHSASRTKSRSLQCWATCYCYYNVYQGIYQKQLHQKSKYKTGHKMYNYIIFLHIWNGQIVELLPTPTLGLQNVDRPTSRIFLCCEKGVVPHQLTINDNWQLCFRRTIACL